ncbi:putative aromatic peroxygenase [Podospora aff. communis PSN243]|uniref:Aromatic peroxygenase n=1 Tax=Podospora aff. communis PSN243 TaxID=3040156 RepID=A0AAV9GGF7_9PEZI|nr:putative aromatic peroxygenase [Podospora aff. communis PSN243]
MTTLAFKAFSVFGGVLGGAIDVVRAVTGHGKKAVDHSWQAPTPTDSRSPCPMINALANHGYLPRDGKNVSLADLITGFKDAINLAPDATLIVGLKALQASSTGNFLTIHLSDLAKHGVIEHDGSLSRHDIHSGDNHTFAPEVWAVTASQLNTETISIPLSAQVRKNRLAAAQSVNPDFHMNKDDIRFSFIETASYQLVFGRGLDGDARTDWVRILFEQERLPFDEGFVRSVTPLGVLDLFAVQKKVEDVSA